MTIKELLKGKSTLDQLEILMRADRMFNVGRYFGGQLTEEEEALLVVKGKGK